MKRHIICQVCCKTFTHVTGIRGRVPKYCGVNCRRKAYIKRNPEAVRETYEKWRAAR